MAERLRRVSSKVNGLVWSLSSVAAVTDLRKNNGFSKTLILG